MFPFTTQHVVIEFPERSKKIPTKKYIAIPVIRGRDKRLTMPEVFDGFVVNRQGAVLWCGRNLWVETAHSHLPCFALCRKTTPNKQRAAKPYKMAMNWVQITQKKQQQAQVYVNTIFFPYSCIYFYVLTTTMNFSYKVFKSFVICKRVSKLAVIYAPSLGRLWCGEQIKYLINLANRLIIN